MTLPKRITDAATSGWPSVRTWLPFLLLERPCGSTAAPSWRVTTQQNDDWHTSLKLLNVSGHHSSALSLWDCNVASHSKSFTWMDSAEYSGDKPFTQSPPKWIVKGGKRCCTPNPLHSLALPSEHWVSPYPDRYTDVHQNAGGNNTTTSTMNIFLPLKRFVLFFYSSSWTGTLLENKRTNDNARDGKTQWGGDIS